MPFWFRTHNMHFKSLWNHKEQEMIFQLSSESCWLMKLIRCLISSYLHSHYLLQLRTHNSVQFKDCWALICGILLPPHNIYIDLFFSKFYFHILSLKFRALECPFSRYSTSKVIKMLILQQNVISNRFWGSMYKYSVCYTENITAVQHEWQM